MKKLTAVAALAAAALAALVTVQIAGATGGHPQTPRVGGDVQHIFVIVLENHSRQSVLDDPNAPTPFMKSLAQHYASAADYYGVTHPSEPNYLALLSGSNWWINQDDPNTRLDHVNLVDELEAAHKTWGAYMEALPPNKTDPQWPSYTALYANKHNPFVLFNDILGDPARMANVKPSTDLAGDLGKTSTTPDFAFIVPDQCNDMHGGVSAVPDHPETPCPYGSTNDDLNDFALKQKADKFVEKTVTAIMASPSWKQGQDAIFVVSDEGDYTGNTETGGWDSTAGCCDSPVLPAGDPDISAAWPGGVYGGGLSPAVVVVNRGGKTGGYVSDTPYNHYSLLATIEDVWRLPRLAYTADTAQVTPMTEFFTR